MDLPYDIAVIGGGIVGLATAYALTEATPCRLILLEQESALAAHQTGRNSGVVHSGIYYKPGSLKARLCIEGRAKLLRFCRDHGVPYEARGKLIIATTEVEIAGLKALAERGAANGLTDLRILNPDEVRAIEPQVAGQAGLWVPQTAITDFTAITEKIGQILRARGHAVRTRFPVRQVQQTSGSLVLSDDAGSITSRFLVNCGGLWCDRIARLCGVKPPVRIIPFRGEYYEVVPEARGLVRHPIYPVPDASFPFLGVHFTPTLTGQVLCGPNAVPALRRDGYRWRDISARDVFEIIWYRGTWRLARRFGSVAAAEVLRSLFKQRFVRSLQMLVPRIRADQLRPARSGVRAQAVDRNGNLVDDFLIVESDRAVHVLNAPSPAATASFAIGTVIADRIIQSFGLDKKA